MEDADRVTKHLAIALALAAAACAHLNAQPTVIELDPAQTQIEFTLGTLLHTVHGSFRLKQGTIRFDPATGKAGGAIVVDATSGNSGNGSRDNRMHKSIIESPRFPEIAFTPDSVAGALTGPGPWHLKVHGSFKIHGVAHEMVLPVEAQLGPDRFTATMLFAVPYVSWGMKNPSTFVLRVDPQVGIEIHAAGRVVSR
jgi:polyisoprenoid-binding protein YceI